MMKKGEVPFVWILIPLILGILAGNRFEPSFLISGVSVCLLLFLLITLIILVFCYGNRSIYTHKWIIGAVVFLLIFLAGSIRTVILSQKQDSRHFSRSVQDLLIVVVNSEPKETGNTVRFEGLVTNVISKDKELLSSGKLLVTLKFKEDKRSMITYGTQLLVPSCFTLIEAPHNPSEFDYKRYLSNRSIYHQIFLEASQIRLLGQYKGNLIMNYAIKSRQDLVDRFAVFMQNKDAIAIASALILGYRAELSEETIQAYSSTGTMHVLSVSGMHVAIIYVILNLMLAQMDRSDKLRILKAFTIILFIFAYTILTGLSAAACRAALMINFLILGKTLKRSNNSYNLLAISAVILLVYNPFFLFDVGFQLSYLAVVGLIFIYPKIYCLYYTRKLILDRVWAYSALSISAQIATLPLSLFYFHLVPLYFLIGNLLIVLPVAAIMYLGMIFILIPVDMVSRYTGWALEQTIVFTNTLIFKVENLPGSTITGIWLNIWEYLLISLVILLLLLSFSYRMKKLLQIGLAAIFILVSGRSIGKIVSASQNEVIFYSLRKNYAIGLLEGRKAHIVTDLKESDKTFSFSIKPHLDENMIEKINLLSLGAKLETNCLLLNGPFIQFRNWKIFIWDKKEMPVSSPPIFVNAVLIRNNSLKSIETLMKAITCKHIIFDHSNYDSNIQKWIHESKKLKLNYYVLKRNSSVIIEL